ncbi:nectin-2 isoform X4 [Hemicordylus capensis]|uniref:nectin-2 isoform X4 n=1 Tax=Hemicordylus capensis TaxID=884348 RepID=UPI002302A904|nr:nectin-2 isoform X4 [Hemicordylus capensis]
MNAAVTVSSAARVCYTGPADLVRLLEQGLFCQLFEREGMGRAGPRGTSLYQAQRSDAWVICVGSKLASGGREKTTRGVFTQRVRVRDEVTGYLGQEVILPCNFAATISDIKVSQVTWVKETAGRKQNVAVYHPDHGPSYPMEPVSRRIHFRTPSLEDATLIIDRLLMTDEGTYTCEFATYPLGNEDGVTNLIILAKPTNTAKSLEVKIGNNAVPVAVCTSAQGKPPARITWQPESSVNSSVSEVENADGTVTVTSQYIMVPTREANEQHITCLVEHKTLPQPQSIPVELSILYPPEVAIEGYDDNWYLSRSEAMLQCIAKGNPKPTEFTWTTSSGSLPKTVEIQDNKLLVRNVDASVNTTFICKVTNRVGQVSTEQVILVRDQPAKRQSSSVGALAGSVVGGAVVLALLGAGVFLVLHRRRRSRATKGSYDPKTRVFGNGTAPPAVRNFAELDRPLKGSPGRGRQEDDEYEEEEEEEEREERHPPYGYPSHCLEDEEERFDQLGPMLRLGSTPRGYEYDDMESQHDGSIISKTAVYV